MNVLHDIWWLLVLIGVMILIHELGHYWAARFFDVRVDTFSFGFGPRLFGFKKGETDFRFSAILFGGYVKMAGQEPGDENANDPRAFLAKPRWQRLIISFAGPFMNIVLAVGLLAVVFMVHFEKVPNKPDPVIGYVEPGTVAAKADLREGDQIVQIDNKVDPTWEDVGILEGAKAGFPLDIWYVRDGQRKHVTLTPSKDKQSGTGVLGWEESNEIEIGDMDPGWAASKAGLKPGDILVSVNGSPIRTTRKLPDAINALAGKPVDLVYARAGQQHQVTLTPEWRVGRDGRDGLKWRIGIGIQTKRVIIKLPLPQALAESVRANVRDASLIYTLLKGIVEHRMSAGSMMGPIGIAQVSGRAARGGVVPFVGLMSAVSLNLAVFNLLPIPILDGGVILLLLIEMFMRRDLSLRVKENVFKAGFVFLMAVVAFVIYNDISKLAG
jgi:regulator of sigma E protease